LTPSQPLLATLHPVLAANIWHWWIGVVLFLGLVLVSVGMIAGYLKVVKAQQYDRERLREPQGEPGS
jgi:membrane protein implicated in regulation of membrane protease activity